MRRSLIARDTINSGVPDNGANRSPRHDEQPQALRDEERLRRDAGHDDQAQARAAALRRRSPECRDLREAGALDQYQLTVAKLPLAKDVDDFTFKNTTINEALVRDLAGGGFIAQ